MISFTEVKKLQINGGKQLLELNGRDEREEIEQRKSHYNKKNRDIIKKIQVRTQAR